MSVVIIFLILDVANFDTEYLHHKGFIILANVS